MVGGEFVVNEQQADVVRNIFDWYSQGMSLGQIKRRLEENQIKTASGKSVWSKSVIQEMLCNEKYMGDCVLQKYLQRIFWQGRKQGIQAREIDIMCMIATKETFRRKNFWRWHAK